MNGQPTYGTTLEFYADQIEQRKQYWNQFGDTNLFCYEYANVFDQNVPVEKFDYIILQDTLHHIEPLHEGLQIFYKALKKAANSSSLKKMAVASSNVPCFTSNVAANVSFPCMMMF